MKQVGLYIAGIFRHWLTVVSGPLLSAVLSLVERYTTVSIDFRLYAAIMSAGVLVAMYRAWQDEHRLRTEAEERVAANRPAVVIGLGPDAAHDSAPFMLRNVGTTSAFNIRVMPINVGDRSLMIDDVSELGSASEATPRAYVRGSGAFWARDAVGFFGGAFEGIAKSQWENRTGTSEEAKQRLNAMFGLADLIVPIQIEYRDLGGVNYITQQHFVYDVIAERLELRLILSTRRELAPQLPLPYVIPGARAERRARV